MTWEELLATEFAKPYMKDLQAFLKEEYRSRTIYPASSAIFHALGLTPFAEVRVVLLGQDPYHNPHQAQGLSFSVPAGEALPPSLQNMFKELDSDLGIKNTNGDLSSWARQGVLLLNATLTVREGMARSHYGKGWEAFTDCIITSLDRVERPIVFLLWGRDAQEKRTLIKGANHEIIASAHPSPLSASRGFFGSRPYSRTNDFLRTHGEKEIDWRT